MDTVIEVNTMGIIINFKRFTYIVPKNDIFFATLGRYIPRIIPSIKLIIIAKNI